MKLKVLIENGHDWRTAIFDTADFKHDDVLETTDNLGWTIKLEKTK